MAAVVMHARHHVQNNEKAWKKVFDQFDDDKSGSLDMREVRKALKILFRPNIGPKTLDKTLKKLEIDANSMLDVIKFGELITELRSSYKGKKVHAEVPVVPFQGSILGEDRKLPFQDEVLRIYNNKIIATFVAFCILSNFVINILEKQIDPDTENLKYKDFLANADTTFNIIFIIELWANVWGYGGPVREFWASGWNVFDSIIVTVGILTMVNVLGPPLDKLKLMRAFRVFRLFKRIESLNKIIVALLNSVPGVINAFVVMFIFFCIYAILAVELFRDFGQGGIYYTYDSTTGNNATIDALSARGYVHGIEYYGTFMRALYTLFQVMTGESWSEAVARPLLFGLYENSAYTVGFFFVSFIILMQMVLTNVVVAVLLERFCQAEEVDEDEEDEDEEEDSGDVDAKLNRILSELKLTRSSVAKLEQKFEHSVTELKATMAKVDALAHTAADLRAPPPMEIPLPVIERANFHDACWKR